MPKKKYFDITIPQDTATMKLNKPNLRQFVVVKSYFDHEEDVYKEEQHIFTCDSFKKAIKIAYKSMGEECYIEVLVYEADGETLVNRLYQYDVKQLYKIKEYLK